MSITGWGPWPATAGTDIGTYDFLARAWYALQEKFRCGLNEDWPTPSFAWDTGAVTGATLNEDGTISVTMAVTPVWSVEAGTCYPAEQKRWVNYTPTYGPTCLCPPCFIPVNYDLVVQVDERDNRTIVRGKVIGQSGEGGTTGTLILNGQNIKDAITAKYISGLSALVGATYVLILEGGPVTGNRLPEQPDDPPLWVDIGNVGTGYRDPATGDTTEYTTLKKVENPANRSWADDEWAGKQLMIGGGAGLLRLTLVHNDKDTIYLPIATSLLPGDFSIVNVNAKSDPRRPQWQWDRWYSGSDNREASHTYYESIATAKVPMTQAMWVHGYNCGGGECDDHESGHPAFDLDIAYPGFPADTETATCNCGRAGKFVHNDIQKTVRALQNAIDGIPGANGALGVLATGISAYYVDKDYTSGYPWTYTPARMFRKLGINSGLSTLTWYSEESGGITTEYYYFQVDTKYAGHMIHYTIVNPNGPDIVSRGYAVADQYGYVNNAGGNHNGGESPNDDGRTVIYSAGRTRYRPAWFKYHRPKTVFQPDIVTDPDTGISHVADPPETDVDDDDNVICSGPGQWVTAPASTGGIVVSNEGVVYDSAEPFVTNALYRCGGDNFGDPFPGGDLQAAPQNLLIPYADKFYRGRLRPDLQQQHEIARGFKVTAGTKFSATDATKDWTVCWMSGGGNVRVESGTATGGSSTSLLDSTKDTTDPTLVHKCFWDDTGRFTLKPSTPLQAYKDFILEVDKTRTLPDPAYPEDPAATIEQAVTFKVPITSTTNGAGGIQCNFTAFSIPKYHPSGTWTTEAFVVASGDVYRIPEPRYEVNRWRDCEVVFTKPNGTILDPIKVTHSDRNTLFFAAQTFEIEPDWTGEIIDRGYGGVWKWDGTKMVKPTGADLVRNLVTTPANFHDDQTENLESWFKDYGPVHYGDLLDGPDLYGEIYRTLNLLKKTIGEYTWTNKTSIADTEGEYNYGSGSATASGNINPRIESYKANYAVTGKYDNYAPFQYGEVYPYGREDGNPDTYTDTYPPGNLTAIYVTGSGAFAYGKASGIPTFRPCDVEFWAIGHGWDGGFNYQVQHSDGSFDPRTYIPIHSYTGPGTEDQAYKWATVGGSDPVRFTSSHLGPDVSTPPAVYTGVDLAPDGAWMNISVGDVPVATGYRIEKSFTIIDWDMEFMA